MSSAAKKSRREDNKLGEDTEGEVTNFLTPRELGRVRATERGARNRKYSAAITKITVPRNLDIPPEFWDLYNLSTVTEINAGLSRIRDTDLFYVAQHCSNLTTVNFYLCTLITDEGVIALVQGCSQLLSLNLQQCTRNITDASMIALAQGGCPNLTSLNLCDCKEITDAGVIALAQGCKKLSALNLKFCKHITDAAVIALAQGCPRLSYLDLGWCKQITNAAVIALAQGCPRLSHLDLAECYMITDEGVIALAQGCPELATLSLYECERLTDASIIALAGCRKLKKLDLRYTEFDVFDDWEKLIYNAQSFFDTEVRNKGLGLSSGASSASGGGESKSSNFLELHRMAEYLRLRF